MSRVPAFPPKAFYRIAFSNNRTVLEQEMQKLIDMIEQGSTSMVSEDLARRFQRGNGLVVASWDNWNPDSQAEVKALGVVVEVGANETRIVKWVPTYEAQCNLPRIELHGAEHWNKPVFQFLGNVPKAFRLADLFAKYMADPFIACRKHR